MLQNSKRVIKRAIHLDSLNLIKSFCELNDPSFNGFCSEWKKTKFHNIFSIIMSETDMVHTTIEIFYICKRILSQDRPEIVKIGAVYLLYTVYFQQPATNFVKIEVSLKTFKSIEDFVHLLNDNHKQVKFIFFKLLRNDAFRFVENEVYYGLEKFLNESLDYNEVSFNEFSIRELFKNELLNLTHEAAGNLAAFKLLENNYEDIKKELNMHQVESPEKLDMPSFYLELRAGMDSIKRTLECKSKKELVDNKDDENESRSSLQTKKTKIKDKALKKMVESRNKTDTKTDTAQSEKKTDPSTSSKNVEKRGKGRRFGNRFDEINFLLAENLPCDILKEFG